MAYFYVLDSVLSRCSLVGTITDMRCKPLQTSHRTTIYIWDASLDANDTNWCSLCTPCMDMASGSGGWWFRVKEFSLARIRDVPKLSRYNKKSGWLQKEREAKEGMEGKLSKLHFQASLKRASAYGLGNRSGFGKVTIYWATCNK